jgi:hypothetical protein
MICRQVLAKIRPELDKSGIDAHGVDDVLHDLEKVRGRFIQTEKIWRKNLGGFDIFLPRIELESFSRI